MREKEAGADWCVRGEPAVVLAEDKAGLRLRCWLFAKGENGGAGVAAYAVSFLGPNEEVLVEEVRWFEHDDQALDEIGRSDHPHEICVHQGERLVARFPPWPPKRPQ